MSKEPRSKASLMVLRALASDVGTIAPSHYRIASDHNMLSEADAQLVLAALPKPVSCISRLEENILVLKCQKLEDEHSAPGVVKAWILSQRKLQDVLVKRIVQIFGEIPDDLSIRIVAGAENTQLAFTEYCGSMLEYHFPEAFIREDHESLELVKSRETLTMRYQTWSDPPMEGSVRFSKNSL